MTTDVSETKLDPRITTGVVTVKFKKHDEYSISHVFRQCYLTSKVRTTVKTSGQYTTTKVEIGVARISLFGFRLFRKWVSIDDVTNLPDTMKDVTITKKSYIEIHEMIEAHIIEKKLSAK